MYRALRRMTAFLAVAFLTVGVVGCGSSSSEVSTNPADLNGTWMLATYRDSNGDIVDVDPEVNTELTLADGQSTGVAGVNTFTGSYEASDDGSLEFGVQASTLMAGPEKAQAQEDAFFAVLDQITRFEVDGTSLTFLDEAGDELATLTAVGTTEGE